MNRTGVLSGVKDKQQALVIGHGAEVDQTVFCEICRAEVPLRAATIASSFADGRPAFACETHKIAFNEWAIFWCLFYLKEFKNTHNEG